MVIDHIFSVEYIQLVMTSSPTIYKKSDMWTSYIQRYIYIHIHICVYIKIYVYTKQCADQCVGKLPVCVGVNLLAVLRIYDEIPVGLCSLHKCTVVAWRPIPSTDLTCEPAEPVLDTI